MLNHARAYILYPIAERLLKRDIRSKVELMREFRRLPLETRKSLQQKKLHEIVAAANQHVPYYRDLFRTIGFQPDRILKSIDSLQEIPVLTKDILREQGSRMLSEVAKSGPLHIRETNGSTGLSTTVWYDQKALDWTAAASLFASELTGCLRTNTSALLSSKFFEKRSRREVAIDQIKCWSMNRINVQTHAFDHEGLEQLLFNLREACAYSVQGHPSTAYFLAVHATQTNQNVRGLFKVYQSTGESLERSKVQIIEETFDCQVFNRYGNAEFGVIAQSRDDFNELEIIDSLVVPEAHSLGNGLDELVFTGLRNAAMPLIRYKTGDVGEISSRDSKYIRRLTGRVHDIVELNGQVYPTHYIKDILERIGGLDEFQFVQNRASSAAILKLVPNNRFNKVVTEKQIIALFGDSVKIEITDFNGLVMQGWRDKFRYLVKGDR